LQQGKNALSIFFLPKKFFLLPIERGASEKYKYLLDDYCGGLKTEKLKNLRFKGRRIKEWSFLPPPPPPPAPMLLPKLRLSVYVTLY
jgi:hypothetical protein